MRLLTKSGLTLFVHVRCGYTRWRDVTEVQSMGMPTLHFYGMCEGCGHRVGGWARVFVEDETPTS